MQIPCENMSRAPYENNIYFIRPIENLYFIIHNSSENAVWTSDDVSMPF